MEDESNEVESDTHNNHIATAKDGLGPADDKIACEGLVFGELEDEEEFKTPLAASRSSSTGAADAVQGLQGSSSNGHVAKHTVDGAADSDALASALEQVQLQQQEQHTAPEPAAADDLGQSVDNPTAVSSGAEQVQDVSGTSTPSAAADAHEVHTAAASLEHEPAGQQGTQDHNVAAAPSSSVQRPSAHADASDGDQQAPQLQTAGTPAGTPAGPKQTNSHKRQSSLPEPQVWREGSGLVTLAVPGQQHSSVGTGSEDDSDSEPSWAAYQLSAAAAAATSTTADTAAPVVSPFGAVPAAAAAPEDSSSPSPVTALSPRQQQQLQQTPRSPLSMVSLGSLGSPRGSGGERTASWQLQHAAAAAAGTAAHPAPPRSDMQLTRLRCDLTACYLPC